MIEKFLKNYNIKTYDEVQNLLKNESLNKKRKILEKAIKQAKHATNVLRGQQTGVKRQYKRGMITEKTRDEKMNFTKAERTTLMNQIKLDKLNGKINRKSIFLEDLTEILKQKVSGDEIEDTREEGKHILDKQLRNHVINELQHKKIFENYFVNPRSK